MIRLDIQDYCEACCDFEPDVTKPEKTILYGDDPKLGRISIHQQSDTIIRCKYAKRCESIKRYLKQQIGENKDNEKPD